MENQSRPPLALLAAGLVALGLTGQLAQLASADLVWYLSQRHETTAVGVMLGMAAARRGSMDHTISKMLCMHILAFHPPTFPELDVTIFIACISRWSHYLRPAA